MIYKTPHKDSPHQEIELLMSFILLKFFKPNEHTEDYLKRKPIEETFLFEIGDKNYIYVGEKVTTFETNDVLIKFSLDIGLNDIKFPYAYGEENIYFMVHRK